MQVILKTVFWKSLGPDFKSPLSAASPHTACPTLVLQTGFTRLDGTAIHLFCLVRNGHQGDSDEFLSIASKAGILKIRHSEYNSPNMQGQSRPVHLFFTQDSCAFIRSKNG